MLRSERAPDGFAARHDATSRAYCYRLLVRGARAARSSADARCTGPTASTSTPCTRARPRSSARHDFTAFTPTETDHVRFERDVLARALGRARADILEFWIEADTFMRNMVRVLVGTMLQVASGRRTVDSVRRTARRAAAVGGR